MSYNKEELFYFMDACADDDLPDGAWQAALEAAAQEWASERNLEIDTHDAFMEYVDWVIFQHNGSDQ